MGDENKIIQMNIIEPSETIEPSESDGPSDASGTSEIPEATIVLDTPPSRFYENALIILLTLCAIIIGATSIFWNASVPTLTPTISPTISPIILEPLIYTISYIIFFSINLGIII